MPKTVYSMIDSFYDYPKACLKVRHIPALNKSSARKELFPLTEVYDGYSNPNSKEVVMSKLNYSNLNIYR